MRETLYSFLSIFFGVLFICFSYYLHSPEIISYRHETVSKSYYNFLGNKINLNDFFYVIFGYKKTRADLLWVDLTKYCGEEKYIQLSNPHAFKKVYRIISTDTKFDWAYYYGSSMLGWYFKRTKEAFIVLSQALKEVPDFYYTKLQYAVLMHNISKHNKVPDKIIRDFEIEISRDNHSPLLNIILADYYKNIKRYDDAIRIYSDIFKINNVDKRFIKRAINEITALIILKSKEKR